MGSFKRIWLLPLTLLIGSPADFRDGCHNLGSRDSEDAVTVVGPRKSGEPLECCCNFGHATNSCKSTAACVFTVPFIEVIVAAEVKNERNTPWR